MFNPKLFLLIHFACILMYLFMEKGEISNLCFQFQVLVPCPDDDPSLRSKLVPI